MAEPLHFTILMAYSDDYTLGRLCSRVNAAYARRHGYGFICETIGAAELEEGRTAHWHKVRMLRTHMGTLLAHRRALPSWTVMGAHRAATSWTFSAAALWSALLPTLLAVRSEIACCLHSLVHTASGSDGGAFATWPIPVPYPAVWTEAVGTRREPRRRFQVMINMLVALLGWLHQRRPRRADERWRIRQRSDDAQLLPAIAKSVLANVCRVDSASMSAHEFSTKFETERLPALVSGLTDAWPARERWPRRVIGC